MTDLRRLITYEQANKGAEPVSKVGLYPMKGLLCIWSSTPILTGYGTFWLSSFFYGCRTISRV